MALSSEGRYDRSRAQFERASRTLAGGVATAFRALQQPIPICFDHGVGSHVFDIDGNEYVDYALGFGPMFLGHSPEPVVSAVRRQLERGLGYGACHDLEAELAEAVCRLVPSAEVCVFSSTGSEAVQVALRIARAHTHRARVIKFRGHYHGWIDGIHVGVPGHLDVLGTEGQDPGASASVTLCDWNDISSLEGALADDVAAIIMEPIAVNGGCFLPAEGYLQAARELADQTGALLIFDEVITGFRVALGGAQELSGVLPDLTVLGKALGGGFPISAVCGRREYFEKVRTRQVAHVGTFNANPICAAAGVAALATLERDAAHVYPRTAALMEHLSTALVEEAAAQDLALVVNHVGAVGHVFASNVPVQTPGQAEAADAAAYRRLAAALLDQGIHVIPRGLLYVSTEHADDDVVQTREAVRRAVASLAHGQSGGQVRRESQP